MARRVRTTKELGATIRARRRSLGLTQAALAGRARVSRPWISALEAGKHTAEVGRVLAVIEALDLDLVVADRPRQARSVLDHVGPDG